MEAGSLHTRRVIGARVNRNRPRSQPVIASVQIDEDVLMEVGMGVGPGFSVEQQH